MGVDGRLQSRTYQTQTGETRYVTEVVADSIQFLEPKAVSTEYQPEVEENPFDEKILMLHLMMIYHLKKLIMQQRRFTRRRKVCYFLK